MDYIQLGIGIAGAVFYVKAAQHERLAPFAWLALSLAVSAAVVKLHGGYMAMALGQLALLPAIAIWRVWRHGDRVED